MALLGEANSQHELAQSQPVTVPQRLREIGCEPFAIYESSIHATQVFNENLTSTQGDLSVVAGDPFVQSIISGQVNIWKAGASQI